MDDIIDFLNIQRNDQLLRDIQHTAEKQREYQSSHKYDLEKFGLSENQIRNDCKEIYQSFLS